MWGWIDFGIICWEKATKVPSLGILKSRLDKIQIAVYIPQWQGQTHSNTEEQTLWPWRCFSPSMIRFTWFYKTTKTKAS